MDIVKTLSPYIIIMGILCCLNHGTYATKHMQRMQKFMPGDTEIPLKNYRQKRNDRTAESSPDRDCPNTRVGKTLIEKVNCPATFCQHVSYRCRIQYPRPETEVRCELYNCTGTHHCSSDSDVTIPIEEVCDNKVQCPDANDESLCVRKCRPSCMCIGLSVDFNTTLIVDTLFPFKNISITSEISDLSSTELLSSISYMIVRNVKTIPNKLISSLYNLKTLDVSNNTISAVPYNIFRHLSSLVSLDLSSNMISHLPGKVFIGLSVLSKLDLSDNKMTIFNYTVLSGLRMLRYLTLHNNQISVLPDNMFSGLSALTELYLHNNQISVLPDNVFSELSVLTILSLSHNQISVLPDNMFSGLSALTQLYLDYNQISILPDNVFSGLSSLTQLYLDYNQISILPDNVFSELSVLTILSLSQNQISVLPDNVFSELSVLTKLNLRNNQISVLPDNVFSELSSLTILYLHNNQISVLPDNVFSGLSSLTKLFLHNNQISVLPDNVFSELSSLTILYLHNNQISVLSDNVFSGLSSLTQLYLDYNQISILPDNVFSKLSVLTILRLDNNQISVLHDNAFSGLYVLSELRLENNQISVLPDNMFIVMSGIAAFVIGNNQLSVLPPLPFSMQLLDISYNHFTSFSPGTFTELRKLTLLNIVGNKLEVDYNIFEGLDNLRILLTDTPFMCCVKPSSVAEDKCMKSSNKMRACWFTPEICISEGDAISSCFDLIGSKIQRVCLWIIGACGLIGNFTVSFYRLFSERDNITKSVSLFLMNLSVSDFLMGIYLLIIGVADVYYRGEYAWNDQQWRRSAVCTTAGVLSTISSEMSTFLILLVTIERLIVIVFPTSRLTKKNISGKQAIIISVSFWLIAAALAIFPIVFMQSYFKGEFYSQSGVCLALPLTSAKRPGTGYSFAVFVCLNTFVFIVILISHIFMFKSMMKSGDRVTSSQTRQRDTSVAMTFFLVMATDFCCWFPIGVMGVASQIGYRIPDEVYAWVMVFVLPINAAINPFLYTASGVWRKRRRERRAAERIQMNAA